MDVSRGWNERSFPGLRSWWMRLFGIGALAAALQTLLTPQQTIFSLYLICVWVLGIGAILLVSTHLLAAITQRPLRAVLAGLSRFAPLILGIPLGDGVAQAFFPMWMRQGVWVAPSQIFSHLLLGGCTSGGCPSLGFTLFALVLAIGLGICAVSLGAKKRQGLLIGVIAYALFWLVLLVPSLTAWARLSSYGTTLAAPGQVVEQAFQRVWAGTLWFAERERFWTLPTINMQGSFLLLAGLFLLGLNVALLFPLFDRTSRSISWLSRFERQAFAWPALLLGGLLGISSTLAPAFWLARGLSALFFFGVAYALAKIMAPDDEIGEERTWICVAAALMGTFFLGWPTFVASALAYGLWRQSLLQTWRMRVISQAGAGWFLVIAAWSTLARVDWSALPIRLFLGVFVLCLVAAVWREAGSRLALGEPSEPLVPGVDRLQITIPLLWILWIVALGILWWASGILMFGWIVLILGAIAAAGLWLFPGLKRNIALIQWFSFLLIGLMMR